MTGTPTESNSEGVSCQMTLGGEVAPENPDDPTCVCEHVDGTCKSCQRREARVPKPGVML